MKKFLLTLASLFLLGSLVAQDNFTDSRDGNVYRTISIEGVTWMAENLKFVNIQGAHLFDNNTGNLPFYGLLYSWKAALNACPAGWHLPSGIEFRSLANYLEQPDESNKSVHGQKTPGIELGGMQDQEGTFSEMDESAYYWTSTEYDRANAEYFSYLIINRKPVIDISRKADIEEVPGTEKENKYSVRCVRN
jgi:uncharacterized protein (TIGR02145 family)